MNSESRGDKSSPSVCNFHGLRECFGTYGTGVTVITTRARDGKPRGLAANSFTSLSMDPPLLLWSIGRRARCFAAFMECERFAINVLAADQMPLAKLFAGSCDDKFRDVSFEHGIGDVPLLPDCTAWFECRVSARYEAGDHVIIVGSIDRFEKSGRPGLLFVAGGYHNSSLLSRAAAVGD